MIFTLEELTGACAYWQRQLRLQDWQVAVSIVRFSAFGGEQIQGNCEWLLKKKMAAIRVLDPEDYPASPFRQDMETTLVHELLHLHFAAFAADDGEHGDTDQEQAINAIAQALVDLKRRVE